MSIAPLSGLARRLVRDGALSEEQAQQAITLAIKDKVSLPFTLVHSGQVSASVVLHAASDEFGAPVIDIDCLGAPNLEKNLVDAKLIRKHQALLNAATGCLLLLRTQPTYTH
jgi:type IV pilus assembly protein PilB